MLLYDDVAAHHEHVSPTAHSSRLYSSLSKQHGRASARSFFLETTTKARKAHGRNSPQNTNRQTRGEEILRRCQQVRCHFHYHQLRPQRLTFHHADTETFYDILLATYSIIRTGKTKTKVYHNKYWLGGGWWDRVGSGGARFVFHEAAPPRRVGRKMVSQQARDRTPQHLNGASDAVIKTCSRRRRTHKITTP